jgi:hypothetical protein
MGGRIKRSSHVATALLPDCKEESEMATDLTVALAEDRPGAFSAVAEALGGANVNIEGVAQIDGLVHVLVDDLPAARLGRPNNRGRPQV